MRASVKSYELRPTETGFGIRSLTAAPHVPHPRFPLPPETSRHFQRSWPRCRYTTPPPPPRHRLLPIPFLASIQLADPGCFPRRPSASARPPSKMYVLAPYMRPPRKGLSPGIAPAVHTYTLYSPGRRLSRRVPSMKLSTWTSCRLTNHQVLRNVASAGTPPRDARHPWGFPQPTHCRGRFLSGAGYLWASPHTVSGWYFRPRSPTEPAAPNSRLGGQQQTRSLVTRDGRRPSIPFRIWWNLGRAGHGIGPWRHPIPGCRPAQIRGPRLCRMAPYLERVSPG